MGFDRYGTGFIQDPNVWTYALDLSNTDCRYSFLDVVGEQITEKGIGNGISILIFAGIMASIPTHISAGLQ